MNMREKYDHAIQVAKGLRMQGSADEKNGKLYFNGVVKSEDEKNQIWNAIKTVSSWQGDVVADIRVEAAAGEAAAAAPASKPPETYNREGGRLAEQDRQGTPRQRECLHGHLQRQPRHPDRS
jgi:hypothetical protein